MDRLFNPVEIILNRDDDSVSAPSMSCFSDASFDVSEPSERISVQQSNSSEADDAPTDYLTWRLSPSLSLSDWKVVIVNKGDGASTTYHVHKNILAVGPRKAEFFATLFRSSEQMKLSKSDTSKIVLEDLAASAFPILLDYIYSPSGTLNLHTENATALRYLAQYFGMRSMHDKVMEFIQKDIRILNNVGTYITDSELFDDEVVSQLAVRVCAEHINDIDKSSPMLRRWDPFFLLDVVTNIESTTESSRHLSVLMASYCTRCLSDVSGDIFEKLTDRSILPVIDNSAAMRLLELECDIIPAVKSHKNEFTSLTCLQTRCIRALTLYCKELIAESGVSPFQENNSGSFVRLQKDSRLPLTVQVELSLSIAKQELKKYEDAVSDAVRRLAREQKLREQLQQENAKLKAEVERSSRRHSMFQDEIDEKNHLLAEYQEQLRGREGQIARYRKQLNKTPQRSKESHRSRDTADSSSSREKHSRRHAAQSSATLNTSSRLSARRRALFESQGSNKG